MEEAIRCTCGLLMGGKYLLYRKYLAKGLNAENALDDLDIQKSCCRTRLLGINVAPELMFRAVYAANIPEKFNPKDFSKILGELPESVIDNMSLQDYYTLRDQYAQKRKTITFTEHKFSKTHQTIVAVPIATTFTFNIGQYGAEALKRVATDVNKPTTREEGFKLAEKQPDINLTNIIAENKDVQPKEKSEQDIAIEKEKTIKSSKSEKEEELVKALPKRVKTNKTSTSELEEEEPVKAKRTPTKTVKSSKEKSEIEEEEPVKAKRIPTKTVKTSTPEIEEGEEPVKAKRTPTKTVKTSKTSTPEIEEEPVKAKRTPTKTVKTSKTKIGEEEPKKALPKRKTQKTKESME